jgi:8-oxo-dGTP diphosphatase
MVMAPNPLSLAVSAVILDGGDRCLLLRRSCANRHHAGCWEWPGGKLKAGELFADGLRREVQEECGLEIELTGLAGATEFALPSVHVILLCLEARRVDGEVRLSDEHDQFAWAPLGDVERFRLAETVRAFMLGYVGRKGLSR